MPLGTGGREVILAFLAQATNQLAPCWCLWVHSQPQMEVYAPAWLARGVNLSRICFAHTKNPVSSLKPVFLDSFFRVIILDMPSGLSREDEAFLVQKIRRQNQLIIIIRNFFEQLDSESFRCD